ncbi:MAG: hypothetical protein ACPL7D_01320 [Candidatus Sumerlaeaceae bacterium]
MSTNGENYHIPPLVPVYGLNAAELDAIISAMLSRGEIWLFIYDNHRTILDDYVARENGNSHLVVRGLKEKDARAFLLQP